jgi:3',5'-cyclic AMP phosphodiesterase CpdA
VTRHIVKLTGLQPGATYRYRVGSNGRTLRAGKFQTAKAAGQPFRFAVWGDSGIGGKAQQILAAQIEKQRPDFLLHTGDLIYQRGRSRDYDPYFFRVYAPTLARVPFYGSLGNHDVLTNRGQPFLDNFVLPRNGPPGIVPERNYSFDYGNAHIVVLDSNLSERQLRREIAPWLERDLRASRARWKFVVFHHPPYSSGLHGDEPRTQRALVPALARARVDIVFNGHDHHYERFRPRNGVTYIVTGAGGAGLYRRQKNDPATARYRNDVHSFTQIDINGGVLQGRQIAANGTIIDQWRLIKQ